MRCLVSADPRVLSDPAPSVLLDRHGADALEIVVGFSTADDVAALVKSDLIKAVQAATDLKPESRQARPA